MPGIKKGRQRIHPGERVDAPLDPGEPAARPNLCEGPVLAFNGFMDAVFGCQVFWQPQGLPYYINAHKGCHYYISAHKGCHYYISAHKGWHYYISV